MRYVNCDKRDRSMVAIHLRVIFICQQQLAHFASVTVINCNLQRPNRIYTPTKSVTVTWERCWSKCGTI